MFEHKNTIIAIVLSLIVVIGWQYFIGYPQMEKQRKEALLSSRSKRSCTRRPRSRLRHSPAQRQRPVRKPARPCR